MRRFEPPPSIREIMNVEIAGTKTIVIPEVIPGNDHAYEGLGGTAPEVGGSFKERFVYFFHDRVKGQYHERQVIVDHSEDYRRRSVDELERPETDKSEQVVYYAVVAEQSHPRVGSQQKVHPHREHDYHQHSALLVLFHSR